VNIANGSEQRGCFNLCLFRFADESVLEIVDDFDGDTFRAVYKVRVTKAVYVLHAFQKESKRSIATAKADLHLIDQRLKRARGLRVMVKKRETDIPVTASSGNVFADIALPEPDEELIKAQLASHIRQVVKRRRLTQVAAASAMGIDQPKVSALFNGRLANFSSERLMRLLPALGQDVEITIRAKLHNRGHGRIRVLVEARA
jgi:predicted XRE-type DNA-binding protein